MCNKEILSSFLILAAVVSSSLSEPICQLSPIDEPHKYLVTDLKVILNYAIEEAVELSTELITKVMDFRDNYLKGDKQQKFGQALQKTLDVIKLNLDKVPNILKITLKLVKDIQNCLDMPEIIEIIAIYARDLSDCVKMFTTEVAQAENTTVQIVLEIKKELDLDTCTDIFCLFGRLSQLPEIFKGLNVFNRVSALIGGVAQESVNATICGLSKTNVLTIKGVEIVNDRRKCFEAVRKETIVAMTIGDEVTKIVKMIKEVVNTLKTEVTNKVSEMFGLLNFIEKQMFIMKLIPVYLHAIAVKDTVTKETKQVMLMWKKEVQIILTFYACRIADFCYDIINNLKNISIVFTKAIHLWYEAISCQNLMCLLRAALNIPLVLEQAAKSYVGVKIVIFNIFMIAKQIVMALKDIVVVTLL